MAGGNVSVEEKQAALDVLKTEIIASAGDHRLVFGSGNLNAELVVVGEAPGRQEELQGKPFVGKAGQLLNEMLKVAGIARSEIWVTNVVKWRPAKRNASLSTRPPSMNEIVLFTPWLLSEIRIISPAFLLCLGRAAAQAVISRELQLEKEHGKFYSLDGLQAMATYHPAYVLRWGTGKERYAWYTLQEDMRRLGTEMMGTHATMHMY